MWDFSLKAQDKGDTDMTSATHKKTHTRQMAIIRRELAMKYLVQGYTYRQIREQVMSELQIPTYSLQTVKKDIDGALAERKDNTQQTTEQYVNIELSRIDWQLKEAVAAWEQSKEIRQQREIKTSSSKGGRNGGEQKDERRQKELTTYGDPRYLEITNKVLQERRRLLGLYAPDKQEVSGNITFEDLLIETGTEEEEDE